MAELDSFQTKLDYQFRDPALLQLALTHPSLAHDQGANVQHNQRLEFLGDSVLGLTLAKELYQRFPEVGEGPLTKGRAQLVNAKALAEQAGKISLGDYLILSRSEESNGGRTRESALADAFEAVIGAIFLDGGFDAAQKFILHCFRDELGDCTDIPSLDNPKGELQELLQATSPEAPVYELISTSGPDHERIFEAVVRHEGIELSRGSGKSKKAAESDAAQAALGKLRKPN